MIVVGNVSIGRRLVIVQQAATSTLFSVVLTTWKWLERERNRLLRFARNLIAACHYVRRSQIALYRQRGSVSASVGGAGRLPVPE